MNRVKGRLRVIIRKYTNEIRSEEVILKIIKFLFESKNN